MTLAVNIAQSGSSNVTFRNRIINGAMVIDQRNAGASVNVISEIFTLDRWAFAASQTGKLTCQQNAGSVTPPAGFKNYLGTTSASSYSVLTGDIFALKQNIEGFNTADLGFGAAGASTVTLSFWVRSSLTGTFGASLVNNAFDRSFVFSYTISSANTWEYKTVTVAGDTSGTWIGATNGIGLRIYFNLGCGSTFVGTANTWSAGGFVAPSGATSVVGTSGATFYITGVQLEAGSTASPFEYRQYGTELQLCQRYFYKIVGSSSAFAGLGSGVVTGGTTARAYIKYPVNARTSPTVSFGGTVYVYDGGNGVVTSVNINAGDQSCSVDFTCSGGGLTTGRGCVPNTANASTDFLQFSAEL